MQKHDKVPLKIAAIYGLTGISWILLSDKALEFLGPDLATATRVSILKGWVFVLLTSLLIYWLVKLYTGKISNSANLHRERNQQLVVMEEQLRRQLAENVLSQQKLFATHQTLKAIFSASPIAIVALDPDCKVTLWNRAAENCFGWLEAEVVGRPYPLFPDDTAADARSYFETTMQGAFLHDVEGRRKRKNGELLDVSISTAPLCDTGGEIAGVIVILTDITERKRAAESLQQSEENYRLLFAGNPHPMWVFDLETLAFLEVNTAAVKHYGWTREEFLAMTIKAIRPEEDVPIMLEAVADRVNEGHARVGIWRHRKKDGSVISVEIATHTLVFAGKRAKVALCNDVTEQVKAREQILRLNVELEERVRLRTAELESANSELEAFGYSVSHDLRAPLRHIDGFSKILLEEYADRLDADGRNYLSRISAAVERMGQLINDMFRLAQVSLSGVEKQAVNLSFLAQNVLAELQQLQPERTVACRITAGLEAEGDPRLLRIVMENLLNNAWKYTGKTAEAVIEFGTTERNGEQVYFVRDNGAGFDMDYVDKLFSPLQRLHPAEEFEGTGIGLATVQRIINRHGGRVTAEGEVGRGAAVYFSLPKMTLKLLVP